MSEVTDEGGAVGKGMSDQEYFSSYEDVQIHRLMVGDSPRTQAYADAINKNKHLFEGKVAMDVGAGTGILSLLMAAAGAKKVYAVEASGTAALIERVARDNGFSDVIQVFHDRVENIKLPGGDDEKVDVLVSEWMGFYLLHESMLNSVICARERFLSDDGTVFPSEASIFACPCSLHTLYREQINFWDNVYGFNMSAVRDYALKSKLTKPEVHDVTESDLLAEPTCVKKFNLRWVTEEEIQLFSTTTFVGITRPGAYQGLCLWFECSFDGRQYNEEGEELGTVITLSTSPSSPPTHWKQTVVVFGYSSENTSQQLPTTTPPAASVEKNGQHDKNVNTNKFPTRTDKINEEKVNTCQKETTAAAAVSDCTESCKLITSCEENSVETSDSTGGAENDTIPVKISRLENVKECQKSQKISNNTTHNNDNKIHNNDNKTYNNDNNMIHNSKYQTNNSDNTNRNDDNINLVEKDEVVGWKLTMNQSSDNVRHYTMTVEMLDPDTEEHPMPCYCPTPRCLIITKMLEKEMEDGDIIDCT
ncbi:hypothetical protein Pcinc_015980 [Petrolisthes cinctipes]|uniref:type I protein arginine methyltransferase n=1 Tax=Petrolisthes cinctipes TaxID=88211 RepID=A0AAE1FRZ2_PETCI|nr:hypothetical protein Pcinc_015980 [Petrolisthes cinctipes]